MNDELCQLWHQESKRYQVRNWFEKLQLTCLINQYLHIYIYIPTGIFVSPNYPSMEQYQAHHVNQDLIFQTLRHLCFSLVFPTVPKRTVLKTLFSIKFFKCPRPDGAQNLVFSQLFSTFETKPCSKPCVFQVFPEFPDYTLLKTLCFPSFSSFSGTMEM